jgi:hypothetical protein
MLSTKSKLRRGWGKESQYRGIELVIVGLPTTLTTALTVFSVRRILHINLYYGHYQKQETTSKILCNLMRKECLHMKTLWFSHTFCRFLTNLCGRKKSHMESRKHNIITSSRLQFISSCIFHWVMMALWFIKGALEVQPTISLVNSLSPVNSQIF